MFSQIFKGVLSICQDLICCCFKIVHGISQGKVDIITSQKKSVNCGVIPQDARGKHDCDFKLVGERAEIKQNIESFPKYFSHYLRCHVKKCTFLQI
jgi:hypothetical protein